jgi:hypothetical protein
MKLKGWLAGALLAGGVVLAMRGGCLTAKEAPDIELAGRFDSMCKIARANIDDPVRGVRKLGHYLDQHAGDLLGEWGETLATIERIGDDAKHDQRARLARSRLSRPLRACEDDWMRFGQAVEASPEASALVERFGERLNRTLEIILAGADFKRLPHALQQRLKLE